MREADRGLSPVDGVLLALVAILLLATVGGILQWKLGFTGLFATELLVVLGPVLFVTWRRRLDRAALGLQRPPLAALAGAVLVGAGGFYIVSAVIEAAIEHFAPVPEALRRQMRDLLTPPSGLRPLALDVMVLALAPALCEELLFRGALLGAFRPLGRGLAVLLTALAFGAFHLSLWKLIPTAALGFLAGTVAERSRSVFPAMALHATNNLLVVLLVRAGYEDPPEVLTRLGIALLLLSIGAIAMGLRLVCPQSQIR